MASPTKPCGACGSAKEKVDFSSKQWNAKKLRRCKECVESNNPLVEGGGDVAVATTANIASASGIYIPRSGPVLVTGGGGGGSGAASAASAASAAPAASRPTGGFKFSCTACDTAFPPSDYPPSDRPGCLPRCSACDHETPFYRTVRVSGWNAHPLMAVLALKVVATFIPPTELANLCSLDGIVLSPDQPMYVTFFATTTDATVGPHNQHPTTTTTHTHTHTHTHRQVRRREPGSGDRWPEPGGAPRRERGPEPCGPEVKKTTHARPGSSRLNHHPFEKLTRFHDKTPISLVHLLAIFPLLVGRRPSWYGSRCL